MQSAPSTWIHLLKTACSPSVLLCIRSTSTPVNHVSYYNMSDNLTPDSAHMNRTQTVPQTSALASRASCDTAEAAPSAPSPSCIGKSSTASTTLFVDSLMQSTSSSVEPDSSAQNMNIDRDISNSVPKIPSLPLPGPSTSNIEQARGCMSRVCNREGIVWVKMYGYRPWPAQIVDPKTSKTNSPSFKAARIYKQENDDTLVTFFGTHEVAWVRKEKAIRPWKAGLNRRFHVVPKRKKSFHMALREVRTHCGLET